MATDKTFYLETFGCQMNAHDSEKVIGTLRHEATGRWSRRRCRPDPLQHLLHPRQSEQKVFNRLNDYKKLHKAGKRFGVLGCVAQQEGKRSLTGRLTCRWFPGRPPIGNCLICWRAWRLGRRASRGSTTGKPTRHLKRSLQPARIPIAATSPLLRVRQVCAYCVVPYTRGRSGAEGLNRFWRGAEDCRPGL